MEQCGYLLRKRWFLHTWKRSKSKPVKPIKEDKKPKREITILSR